MRQLLGLMLLASSLTSLRAHAAGTPGCQFTARTKAAEELKHMDPAVIGYVNCQERTAEVYAFMVARFPKLDAETLAAFVARYAPLEIPDATRSHVVRQQREASGLQSAVIETLRERNGAPFWHFAFTAKAKDGQTLLFIHTSGAQETRAIGQQLNALKSALRGQAPRQLASR